MKKYLKLFINIFISIILILFIIEFLRAYFYCNTSADLQPWHYQSKLKEPEYSLDIDEYLIEENKFLNKIFYSVETNKKGIYCRYSYNSVSSPFSKEGINLNTSFQMIPKNIKGGVLLLHGLTDSPAMMRDIGKFFYDKGYYVLCLRYKYHGTIPGELLNLTWKDFKNSAILGSKIIQKKIKNIDNAKFYMVGFSTGAAASLEYILQETRKDSTLLIPNGIFWFSPAMGVSPATKIGFLDLWTSKIPGFEKFKWLDIYPEYDPCKYNSFPKKSGIEVAKLIDYANKGFNSLNEKEILNLPPIYSYNSLVDATVIEKDLYRIFSKLKNPNNELTIFDTNRKYEYFFNNNLKKTDITNKINKFKLNSKVTLITNCKSKTDDKIDILHFTPNGVIYENTNLKWNPFVFSLSHVALPISIDNYFYGEKSILGSLEVKGENNTLSMSSNLLYRLRYNPFFSFIKEDISKKI